jgi:hypothetical protein
MNIRRFLTAAALTALTALPLAGAAGASEAHSSWCLLGTFKVTQVASLYAPQVAGRAGAERFTGAQVFLPAQPGLTAEWIAANISRHTASEARSEGASNCPLDVSGASVKVASGGTGFWVQIAADDADAAKEILNRARNLVH